MDVARFPNGRAVLVAASVTTALTLPVSGALAQMYDIKKMPGMNDSKMSDTNKTKTADGTGTITALNAANHKITFDHGPIPAIDWPAMKMEFAVAPSVDLAKQKTGDKVKFTLSGSGNTYTVQSISPAP